MEFAIGLAIDFQMAGIRGFGTRHGFGNQLAVYVWQEAFWSMLSVWQSTLGWLVRGIGVRHGICARQEACEFAIGL